MLCRAWGNSLRIGCQGQACWRQALLPTIISNRFNTDKYEGEVVDADYVSGEEIDESDNDVIDQSLSLAEKAKSLVHLRISGTLSSLAVKMNTRETKKEDEDDLAPPDSPPLWASIMPYVIHDSKPHFGVFPQERHSANLYLHEKASLVVYSLTPKEYNPSSVPVPRVNLSGVATPVPAEDLDVIKEKFVEVHKGAKKYVGDYNFFALEPREVAYYQQGDLRMIDIKEYEEAMVDEVCVNSRPLLSLFNTKKYTSFLPELCFEYANEKVREPILYHIDRYGFNLIARSKGNKFQEFRFPFPFEMKTAEDASSAMQQAIRTVVKQ